eukprot:EG_transcript_5046
MDSAAAPSSSSPEGPLDLASLFQPRPTAIPVIVHELKQFGPLWIETKHIEHTRAVERWLLRQPNPPSMCLLRQRKRCHVGEACNQVHINPAHLLLIRQALSHVPCNTCCPKHGDLASLREDFHAMVQSHPIELRLDWTEPLPMPPERIAITRYWDRFLKAERVSKKKQPGRVFRFTPSRVCPLHQSGECSYGVDCKNVHVCREYWATDVVAKGLLPPEEPDSSSAASLLPGQSQGLKGGPPPVASVGETLSPTAAGAPAAPFPAAGAARAQIHPSVIRSTLDALREQQRAAPPPPPPLPRSPAHSPTQPPVPGPAGVAPLQPPLPSPALLHWLAAASAAQRAGAGLSAPPPTLSDLDAAALLLSLQNPSYFPVATLPTHPAMGNLSWPTPAAAFPTQRLPAELFAHTGASSSAGDLSMPGPAPHLPSVLPPVPVDSSALNQLFRLPPSMLPTFAPPLPLALPAGGVSPPWHVQPPQPSFDPLQPTALASAGRDVSSSWVAPWLSVAPNLGPATSGIPGVSRKGSPSGPMAHDSPPVDAAAATQPHPSGVSSTATLSQGPPLPSGRGVGRSPGVAHPPFFDADSSATH